MTLLSLWALPWLAAAAAVLGLYLLRPRSRRVEVSSTWLWRGALRDESARSLLQWLKRHLLLLLQLAVVLISVFALARPAFRRDLPVGRTVVLAMDVSAAMLASDGDPVVVGRTGGGPAEVRSHVRPSGAAGSVTRLDEARARASQYLAQLRPGDRAVVLRMAGDTQVAARGTVPADLGTLQAAIEHLQALPSELDLAQALEVAGSLTQSARLGEIIIFTGGTADTNRVTRRPPAAIQVVTVGQGSIDNQAITTLAARRSAAGGVEAFVRLRNFGDQPATGTLRVKVDGELYEAQTVTLPPRGSPGEPTELLLAELPAGASVIEALFDRTDLLALDNVAMAAVAAPPLRKVALVGGRSDQLERALRAVPGVELTKLDPAGYDPKGGYDVYVFEGWFPPSPPPGHWLLIDPPAKSAALTVTGTLGRQTESGRETNEAQIMRLLPSPLLEGVDLTGVSIVEAKKVVLPDWAEEVVAARQAPLIFMGYPRPYRAVVFSFDLRASNLFGRVGFPVLISNVVNWLTGEVGQSSGLALAADASRFVPGEALLIQPLPRTTRVQVETPSKKRYRFNGHQPVRFADTAMPGSYVVTQFAGKQEIVRRVYVASILQPGREAAVSDLGPRQALQNLATVDGPGAVPVTLGPGREQRYHEWWRALGVLALAGLLAEWWWFHR